VDVSQVTRCMGIAGAKVAAAHDALLAAVRADDEKRRARPDAAVQ
jgi:hypothetical protein